MSDFFGRVVDAVYTGNIELLEVLYNCGFLRPNDTFQLDNYRVSILHLIARKPCPDYMYMIDTLLNMGVCLDDAMPNTPLEEALIYENFATAQYLESLGGTYCNDEVDCYLDKYREYKENN